MDLFSELQGLMSEHRFSPEKRFGQHFIIDEGLLEIMVKEAGLKQADVVLEIGCGTGFLTSKLLEKCKVVGVENDKKMAEILRQKFRGNKGFALIEGDFLSAKLPKFNKVVSLPPYNISTEIMMRLFAEKFEKAVIVFQKEFVEKLVALPGFWDYNYVSALTSVFFKPKVLIHNLSPKVFFPKPESFSSLVVLDARKRPRVKFAEFAHFLKNLFRYKNKNLSNALEFSMRDSGIKLKEKELQKIVDGSGLGTEKVSLIEGQGLLKLFNSLSR